MSRSRGFTLIETLIASLILVSGLVAVAAMFSYSIRTNLINQRRTAALALLYDKIEELKSIPLTDSRWNAGNYSDVIVTAGGTYFRKWNVSGTASRRLTVVIQTQYPGSTGGLRELCRATTSVSEKF
jgi:prepilin-type N-terminal cleavage/methylation domain-containing protein